MVQTVPLPGWDLLSLLPSPTLRLVASHLGREGPEDSHGAVPLLGCPAHQREGLQPVGGREVHHRLPLICQGGDTRELARLCLLLLCCFCCLNGVYVVTVGNDMLCLCFVQRPLLC